MPAKKKNNVNVKKETDPYGMDAKTPGAKLDAGKLAYNNHLFTYFPHALDAVCQVSEFGARKYTRMGWASVPGGIRRYTDALSRHLMDEARGDVFDKDSGLTHAAHLAWNALARLQLMLDDRVPEETQKVIKEVKKVTS